MDARDKSIGTQVVFKGAIDLCKGSDLTQPQGQEEFVTTFLFLMDVLLPAMESNTPEQQAAQIIQGNFPGTTVVASNEAPSYNPPPQYAPQPQANGGGYAPQYANPSLSVKGPQHGPLPEWLFEAAAAKGVVEVYDNRDRAASNPKYPLFKSTSGGPQAPAFWQPGR